MRCVGVWRRELGRCMERRQRGELGWWRWEPRPHWSAAEGGRRRR